MLWAVLVMLMISLISSGVIFLGRAYYMQERKENYRIQAKLYAESAIDLIQTDICENGASSAYYVSGCRKLGLCGYCKSFHGCDQFRR